MRHLSLLSFPFLINFEIFHLNLFKLCHLSANYNVTSRKDHFDSIRLFGFVRLKCGTRN
jgi:hypothetical protein